MPKPSVTTTLSAFGASELVAVMRAFREALRAQEKTINRLNVFPVPDGDTGTNMLATVTAVLGAVDEIDKESMSAVCGAISLGSLMGARGNSGVILCQILRGLAQSSSSSDVLESAEIATGLIEGSTAANAAVLRPAPGTMLTVAADAAQAAQASAGKGDDLSASLLFARNEAVASLHRTPQLLSVLADAGVVDAGGAGLVLLYEALHHVASGGDMPSEIDLPAEVAERLRSGAMFEAATVAPEHEDGSNELRFEVMYFLEAPDSSIEAFKNVWAGLGDSIVVVGGDGLFNCHVHTNDIGGAIEAALDVGRPRQIRVSDLNEQVEEERWVRERATEDGFTGEATSGEAPLTSIVTVGSGEGIHRIFRSLGVERIVAGGQSMNPSTREILDVIEDANGKQVVVLPNNTNIYPVAAQAAELASKPVFVVPTAGVQEGFAALLDYDPQADGEANAKAMTLAARRIIAGEVTQAVRATTSPVGPVAEGDFIGLSRDGIESVAQTLSDATVALLEVLLSPSHEIVTLIEGGSVPAAEHRRVTEWLAKHHPDVDLEVLQGGQPLYPYFISIE